MTSRPSNPAKPGSWAAMADHLDWVVPILIAVAVFFCGAVWPAFRPHIMKALLLAEVVYLMIRFSFLVPEFLRPFNYRSLILSDDGFVYEEKSGQKQSVAWDEITQVKFARYMEWYEERSWFITSRDKRVIQVLDEWPDRRKLLAAFRKHLPGFSVREARRGFYSWKKSRWTCFQRKLPSPSSQPPVLLE